MYANDSDWWAFIAILIAIGIAIGWVLFVGFPMAWEVLKPFIHGITR